MKFWMLWGWDALIGLVILYFFFGGLADGSVSSFNMGLWLVILAVLAAVMWGSLLLRYNGRPIAAVVVLLLLALPGVLFALFFLLIILTAPRWN